MPIALSILFQGRLGVVGLTRCFLRAELTVVYRAFGGVAMPMSMQTSANGQQIILISIEEIVVNEPIADELFERPE